VEIECVSHNFTLFAIFLSKKIIKIDRHLTKFWQKQICTVFETQCICRHSCVICVGRCQRWQCVSVWCHIYQCGCVSYVTYVSRCQWRQYVLALCHTVSLLHVIIFMLLVLAGVSDRRVCRCWHSTSPWVCQHYNESVFTWFFQTQSVL